MKTVQWKLPGTYEGDLNEDSSNGGYVVSYGHLLDPGETSSIGTGLHPIELVAKAGPMEILKQIILLLRQWVALCKLTAPLTRTTSTQRIEHRKVDLGTLAP